MLFGGTLYLDCCTKQSCTLVFLGSGLSNPKGRNDNARLFLRFPRSFRIVHYNPTSAKHFSFSVGSVPRALQPQLGILRYFASYMEQHLMKVCRLHWGDVRDLGIFDSPSLVRGEG